MNALRRWAPRAPKRFHLAAAASLWSLAGLGLFLAGFYWIETSGSSWMLPAVALALVAGAVKFRFVLRKTARKIVTRIERRGDGKCLGGFLSWGSWGMVAGFSILGRLLRASAVPRILLGGIYFAVGVALLGSSLVIWGHWWRGRSSPST
jgi:hypothetical protein